MSQSTTFTPEYLVYLERRYNDLKQIVEAMVSYFPYEATEENHALDTIEREMDYLADILGYENIEAFLDRLIENDGGCDE